MFTSPRAIAVAFLACSGCLVTTALLSFAIVLCYPGQVVFTFIWGPRPVKSGGLAVHATLLHCHCFGFPPERALLRLHREEEEGDTEPLRDSGGIVTDWGF